MNYKFFSVFLFIIVAHVPLNASYKFSILEQGKGESINELKRKTPSYSDEKENQKNMTYPHKKIRLSKSKDKNFILSQEIFALKSLTMKINNLEKDIEEAYTNASKMELYTSYNAFKSLDYNEQTWANLVQEMKIERWPSQESWKETVGAHLFFPASRIHKYQEYSHTEHLIQRSDILHGCIFSATFRHSLGLFYTTHILWTINRFDSDIQMDMKNNKFNFYTQALEKTYRELEQLLDRPNVSYALGQASSLPASLLDNYENIKAIEFYKKGEDLKNQHKVLVAKMIVEEETADIIDNFLDLAKQGYFPAYLEAADYANNSKQKDRARIILEEATQKSYHIAWIELAHWYKKNKDLDNYQKCLNHALQANIPHAFIVQGFNLLNHNVHQFEIEKLKILPKETINLAADAFRKAGQLHDPLGFEYLAELKLYLSDIVTSPLEAKALKVEAYEAIKQGCALGWAKSFWKLPLFVSGEKYENVLRKYGPAPDDFIEALENFLKENTETKIPLSF